MCNIVSDFYQSPIILGDFFWHIVNQDQRNDINDQMTKVIVHSQRNIFLCREKSKGRLTFVSRTHDLTSQDSSCSLTNLAKK